MFAAQISKDTADFVFNLANISLIIGTGIVLASTILVIWMGTIKERYSDDRISSNEAATAKANADAAIAKNDAAQANAQLGQANERAAQANEGAAQAQLATEQLKAQLAWRTIKPTVAKALSEKLSQTPGTVFIRYVANDPESTYFAIQFQKIFVAGKWNAPARADEFTGSVFWGILIPGISTDDPVVLNNLKDAFTQAGIPFSTNAPPPSGPIQMGAGKPGNSAEIVIGSKQPPL